MKMIRNEDLNSTFIGWLKTLVGITMILRYSPEAFSGALSSNTAQRNALVANPL